MKINGLINCFLEIYISQIITHLKFLFCYRISVVQRKDILFHKLRVMTNIIIIFFFL